MACKTCGGSSTRSVPRSATKAAVQMNFSDSNFRTVYYIGESGPVIGTTINYGNRNYGEQMLIHINDWNPELFAYELPRSAEPIEPVKLDEKKVRTYMKKVKEESDEISTQSE